MSQEPATDRVGSTESLSLPERAKRVAKIADRYALEADENGQLSEPVVEALHEEGLYGMWVPRSLGGAELDPVSSLQVIENVAYGDPSAGWVMMASALAIGTGGAYLGKEAVDELFGGDRMPVIAGQGTRPGKAVTKNGGYVLSGSWSFASGIKHGTHIHTLGIIEETGEPRIFVLPVEQATLIDNWDVMGLRGTGSIDYTIDEAYVPEAYTHFAVTETPKQGGSLYKLGVIGFAGMCHSGWACGLGRRLLDELAAGVRARGGLSNPQGASDSFQQGYAKAEGTYRSARALVYETWGDVKRTLDAGDEVTTRQHTLIRLAMAHVTWAAHSVATFVYTAGGTNALRSSTIQRLFRDAHAGTQHVVASPPVFAAIGRELSGLDEGKHWQFLNLVGDD
jgi:alkylation response protein AidB-like acyl-CoA dehydrogenase